MKINPTDQTSTRFQCRVNKLKGALNGQQRYQMAERMAR